MMIFFLARPPPACAEKNHQADQADESEVGLPAPIRGLGASATRPILNEMTYILVNEQFAIEHSH